MLVAGSLWRVAGILRLGSTPDLSEPRSTRLFAGAMRGIFARMVPRVEFRLRKKLELLERLRVSRGSGRDRLRLPAAHPLRRAPDRARRGRRCRMPVVYVSVGPTFVSLFIALMERLTDPVRRLLSGFDDYFSWTVVLLPLATGMIAIQQSYAPGAAPVPPLDPLPLAIHLLSVELLFVWLPFGKLAHAFLVFVSRGVTGAALARKGAAL